MTKSRSKEIPIEVGSGNVFVEILHILEERG